MRHCVFCLMVLLSACAALAPQGQVQAQRLYSPVGQQYALAGVQASGWLGHGTLTLEGDTGEFETLGPFTDRAWGAGPVFVGFSHVVSSRVLFEFRAGAGLMLFENDRLIDGALSGAGEFHVSLVLEAEFLGRVFSDEGWTAALGLNLGSVGAPDRRAALMRLSPRVGKMWWDGNFAGYWLAEVGYQFPLINGLLPESMQSLARSPVDASWHVMTIAMTRAW